MDIDLRVTDSPWNRRVTMNTIARRNICQVIVEVGEGEVEEYDLIISAIYLDKNGIEWLQGVNVSDIIDNVKDPDLSNMLLQINKLRLVEFKDSTIYDLDLTAEQASSIMRRTDKIVRLAKDGVSMIEEAERVKKEDTDNHSVLTIMSA